MRYSHTLLTIIIAVNLFSCIKEYRNPINPPSVPPPVSEKHILLKDITIPHLPSPYYHFEYNADSLVAKADFASGFTIQDVFYSGSRIREMRNNILVNHDTLRYVYDNTGKLQMINIINEANVIYKHVSFTFHGDLIREIKWDHKVSDGSFVVDRTLTFMFHADGNVKTIAEHRPSLSGAPEYNSLTTFEQYDNKINVDDFSLIHLAFHDHLFLFQGFRLQKNNPGKEMRSVNGTDLYTINYTYNYNSDNAPSVKTGELLYVSGPNAGERFQTNSFYTYY